MKLGIIDADLIDGGTRHPNLALMKVSSYYKSKGWKVELLLDYKNLDNYNKIVISKVFTFTKVSPNIFKDGVLHEEQPEKYLKDNIEIGGTGFYFDKAPNLPDEIEHIMPDYHLYDEFIAGKSETKYDDYINYSIGFTTRGCFRKCGFCVNKKYDRVHRHSPVSEFFDHSRKYIYLWDDNFMASPDFNEILDELVATGRRFQFRQGLDLRLMTEDKAKRLSEVKYYGDYIFAFDYIKDRELIERKLKIWRKYCNKSTKLYLLCAYESQDIQDIINVFERIKIVMSYGCLPYIMRYEDYKTSEFKDMYIQIARWCNQPTFLKKTSFREFCELNRKSNKRCYATMINFEKQYPEVASKYYDMKFEDLRWLSASPKSF